jgi:DNA-binding NarL/FixJ family response regulator
VIRVLIVDDHPLFRDGMAGLLSAVPDVEVAGAVGSGEEAVAWCGRATADVVLMDINLPGISGVEATRRVLARSPRAAVLVVSMVDDDDNVVAALTAGARGYVLKEASPDEIVAALRTVTAGGAVFGATIAARLVTTAARERPSALVDRESFTARERDVLDLMAEGASNRQIARQLDLSLKTVQNHVSRILDKLQAADRTQAVLRARGISPTGG